MNLGYGYPFQCTHTALSIKTFSETDHVQFCCFVFCVYEPRDFFNGKTNKVLSDLSKSRDVMENCISCFMLKTRCFEVFQSSRYQILVQTLKSLTFKFQISKHQF